MARGGGRNKRKDCSGFQVGDFFLRATHGPDLPDCGDCEEYSVGDFVIKASNKGDDCKFRIVIKDKDGNEVEICVDNVKDLRYKIPGSDV